MQHSATRHDAPPRSAAGRCRKDRRCPVRGGRDRARTESGRCVAASRW